MVVELFGLPGAGKTTTLNHIVNQHKEFKPFFKVKNISKLEVVRGLFSKEFFKLIGNIVKILITKAKNHKLNKRDLNITSFVSLHYLKLEIAIKEESNYIVDHGLVQAIVSLIWNCEEAVKYAEKIFRIFSQLENYLWVYTENNDVLIVAKRIIKREEDRRIKNLEFDAMKKMLIFQKEIFEKAYNVFKEHDNCLLINTNDDMKSNSESIYQYVIKERG